MIAMTKPPNQDSTRDREHIHRVAGQYVGRFPWADRTSMELTLAINACSRSSRNALERSMEGAGVGRTIGRSTVLRALYFADGKPLSHNELGKQLRVTPATVTSMVNGLEKDGLVRRTQGEADRRTSYVAMTDDGREVCERLLPMVPNLSADLWQGFSPEERQHLLGLLLRFLDSTLDYNSRPATPSSNSPSPQA
jgi:DNA-binding MarR family transcriptional regulator